MDNLNKSSTALSKPSAIPKPDFKQRSSSEDTNVDEINKAAQNSQKGIASKSENPKKGTTNFMSPTISMASKASTSKNKISVKRNDASILIFSGTQIEKSPKIETEETNLDLGSDYPNDSSQITPLSSRVLESGLDTPDSSSLHYDPLTNYLSPRPQFLRYKPNRRLEMFLHRENKSRKGEEGLGIEGSCCIKSKKPLEVETSFIAHASSQDELEKQEDGSSPSEGLDSGSSDGREIEESEEDEENINEEEEEERPCNSSLALRFLFLIGILFFSTIYISSANSPSITPLQALGGFGEGYLKIQEPLSRTMENLKMGFEKIPEISKQCRAFIDNLFSRSTPQLVALEESRLSLIPSILNYGDEDNDGDLLFLDDLSHQRVDLEGEDLCDAVALVLPKVEKNSEEDVLSGNFREPEQAKGQNIEKEEDVFSRNHLEQEEANGGDLMDMSETLIDETTGKVALVLPEEEANSEEDALSGNFREPEQVKGQNVEREDHVFSRNHLEQEEANGGNLMEMSETLIDETIGKEGAVQHEMVKLAEVTNQMSEISVLQGRETSNISVLSQIHLTQSDSATFSLQNAESNYPSTSGVELNCTEEEVSWWIGSMKDKFDSRSASGFSLLSVLAASTILGFLRLRHSKVSSKDSSTTFQSPSPESIKVEMRNSEFPKQVDIVVEKYNSHGDPSSFSHFNDNYNDFSGTCPPVVKLLGEYEVGEISCKSKTRGGEQISVCQSQDVKRSSRKSLSFSNQRSPLVSEFAAVESPPCGSFVREGEAGGDVMKEVTTAVRRSNRIRKRVMSP